MPYDWCHYKKRRGQKDRHTKREGHVATDSEIGVMSLHVKEGQ